MTDLSAPWSVSAIRTRMGGEPVLSILTSNGEVNAFVLYGDGSDEQHRQAYAEANLIAAAPEMLEALKECFGTIKEYHEYEHDGDPWTEDARAMGEMDLDAFERDGRMKKISNLIEKLNVSKATEIGDKK